MIAILEYLDLLRDACQAKLLHAKTNKRSRKFLARACIDKQLACIDWLYSQAPVTKLII